MRTTAAFLFSAALISMGVACGPAGSGGDDDGVGDDDDPTAPDAGPNGPRPDGAVSTQRCQKMDILFVVDDSGSMAEEQDNLATNFPMFANVLNAYEVEAGLPLDYRVAITTTGRDVAYTQIIPAIPPLIPETSVPMNEQGDDGEFRQSCGMTRRWLERGDPNMATTFACAADVGTDGPGLEMQLYASELALSPPMSTGLNAGFLRDDALLAVVYLTDENDCSRRDNNFSFAATEPCTTVPVQSWVDFFDNLKGERGRWATAVIAGPNDCTSDFGDAAAATRLQEFVNLTGDNAVFSSICEGNLSGALQQALDTFTSACETFPDID
jgi:hypothetical protein